MARKRLTRREFGSLVSEILSERVDNFNEAYYEPTEKDYDIEDDGIVHITRRGVRYSFFTYDASGELKYQASETDIKKYAKATDTAIKIARNRIRRGKITEDDIENLPVI